MNNSGAVLTHLYVSSTAAEVWGDDILGREVMGPGESVLVYFSGFSAAGCGDDILAGFQGGGEGKLMGVDLCATDTVTFTDLLPAFTCQVSGHKSLDTRTRSECVKGLLAACVDEGASRPSTKPLGALFLRVRRPSYSASHSPTRGETTDGHERGTASGGGPCRHGTPSGGQAAGVAP